MPRFPADAERGSARIDLAFAGFVAGDTRDFEYLKHVNPFPETPLRASRPELDRLVPASAAPEFSADLLPRLAAGELGTTIEVKCENHP